MNEGGITDTSYLGWVNGDSIAQKYIFVQLYFTLFPVFGQDIYQSEAKILDG